MKKLAYVLFFVFFASCCISDEPEKATEPLDIEMVFVEGGEYDKSAYPDKNIEQGTEKVHLNSYRIGKYEVTQAQWKSVMKYNPSNIIGHNLPVNNVSWSDIRVFIKRLNSLTGKTYRLPSVAEWEFAARGGNLSKKFRYSGSDNALNVAWCDENSGYLIHAVGSKQPNELGIYDMCGNVSEWCFTRYLASNINVLDYSDARLIKGQSFVDMSDQLTLNAIDRAGPGAKAAYIGFRIVLDSDQSSENFDVKVVTGDANVTRRYLNLEGTINNAINVSSYGFLIGETPNKMVSTRYINGPDGSFSYSKDLNYNESSVFYYCAYAIDGWDIIKGEIKSIQVKE